jgi:hypothetical protein
MLRTPASEVAWTGFYKVEKEFHAKIAKELRPADASTQNPSCEDACPTSAWA